MQTRMHSLWLNGDASKPTICGNCGWQGPASECDDISDYGERVYPGEPAPAGQCPDCQALCHLQEPQDAPSDQ